LGRANREAAFAALRSGHGPSLSCGASLLLVFIGDLVSDDGGLLEVGCDYMAEALGQSVSSVRRWRGELVAVGHLAIVSRVRGGQKGNTYRLTLHPRRDTNPSRAEGTTSQPSTGGRYNPPPTLHQPSTGGGEQEQEQIEEASAVTADAIYIARHRTGIRNVRAYARALVERESPEAIHTQAAQIRDQVEGDKRNADLAAAVRACSRCDSAGFVDRDDDDGIVRRYRCAHEVSA
jgi:hypothetical protein